MNASSAVSTLEKKYPQATWVDAINTRCPIPILRAKQALKKAEPEAFIILLATDPSTKNDLTIMLKHGASPLLAHDSAYTHPTTSQNVEAFVIQKKTQI